MASVLIISADPQSVQWLTDLCQALHFRFRAVNKIENAKEWLPIDQFSAVLVDSRYEKDVPTDLAFNVWSYQPRTLFGVFNFYGDIPGDWRLRMIGAESFKGRSSIKEIEQALKKLPRSAEANNRSQILLVEDLDSPRMIISAYVEGLGYGKVVGVSSGKEALNELRHNPDKYYCVISDINMPEMSGIELTMLIRIEDKIANLPVVILTSFGNVENLVSCIKAGATSFLLKPPKKHALQVELEKAKRITFNRQSPRLCRPEDSHLIELFLSKLNVG